MSAITSRPWSSRAPLVSDKLKHESPIQSLTDVRDLLRNLACSSYFCQPTAQNAGGTIGQLWH